MNDNETIKNILSRRSVRAYTRARLDRAVLDRLLECAMWAPSARNLQPCRVAVLTDKEILDRMDAAFKDAVGHDTPAYTRWDENPFYQGAAAVFFVFADTPAFLDAGIMVENIAIAAQSLNLGSCIIGCIRELFNAPQGGKWKKLLGQPEDSCFLVSIAVGEKAENPEPKPRNTKNFTVIDNSET